MLLLYYVSGLQVNAADSLKHFWAGFHLATLIFCMFGFPVQKELIGIPLFHSLFTVQSISALTIGYECSEGAQWDARVLPHGELHSLLIVSVVPTPPEVEGAVVPEFVSPQFVGLVDAVATKHFGVGVVEGGTRSRLDQGHKESSRP